MESTAEKVDSETQFKQWADSLLSWEKIYFFNKIALECDVTYQCVYRWATTRTKIKKPFQKIINAVVGKEIITIVE